MHALHPIWVHPSDMQQAASAPEAEGSLAMHDSIPLPLDRLALVQCTLQPGITGLSRARCNLAYQDSPVLKSQTFTCE